MLDKSETRTVEKTRIALHVNGKKYLVKVFPMERLLDVLREDLRLTGSKEGCGEGECGACSVMMDGQLVNSCLVPALQADGTRITTIEGVARGENLHPVQECFLECGGAQCGICTPGMIMASVNLLQRWPTPTPEQMRDGLAGNLCRCTGFMKIFDSVALAATRSALRKKSTKKSVFKKTGKKKSRKGRR